MTRSEVTRASFDEAAGTWTVEVNRDGQPVTLRPTQLVLATGSRASRTCRNSPAWSGSRAGSSMSSQHKGPDDWAGKKAVVIGSNNSAHDICAALWGGRRRCDDGAALVHPYRALGQPDGDWSGVGFIPNRRWPMG